MHTCMKGVGKTGKLVSGYIFLGIGYSTGESGTPRANQNGNMHTYVRRSQRRQNSSQGGVPGTGYTLASWQGRER